MTLGQRIQEYRKAAGLSQEALGEELGVSRQAVSKWESDGGVPELDTLIAMSRRFGVTLGALLGVEEPAAADTPEPAQPAPCPPGRGAGGGDSPPLCGGDPRPDSARSEPLEGNRGRGRGPPAVRRGGGGTGVDGRPSVRHGPYHWLFAAGNL